MARDGAQRVGAGEHQTAWYSLSQDGHSHWLTGDVVLQA